MLRQLYVLIALIGLAAAAPLRREESNEPQKVVVKWNFGIINSEKAQLIIHPGDTVVWKTDVRPCLPSSTHTHIVVYSHSCWRCGGRGSLVTGSPALYMDELKI